jgi:hypothetical protein
MEPEKVPEQLTGLVPDFFFELIARIPPGLVGVLSCVYWSGRDLKADHFGVLGLLVAAWVVGVTLDVGVYRIVYAILPELPEKVRNNVVPDLRPTTEFFRELPVWDRGILFKQFALLVFLRGIMVMCAVTGVGCWVMWLWSGWLCHSPLLPQHYGWCGVVFSILGSLCWWKRKKKVALVCAVLAVLCVAIWLCPGWSSDLPVLYRHYGRYGVVCPILALGFFVSWRAHREELKEWCTKEREAQAQRAAPPAQQHAPPNAFPTAPSANSGASEGLSSVICTVESGPPVGRFAACAGGRGGA